MTRTVSVHEYADFLADVALKFGFIEPTLADDGVTPLTPGRAATFRLRPLVYEPPQHVPNRTAVTTCILCEVLHNGEWLIVGREFSPNTDANTWTIEDDEWDRVRADETTAGGVSDV